MSQQITVLIQSIPVHPFTLEFQTSVICSAMASGFNLWKSLKKDMFILLVWEKFLVFKKKKKALGKTYIYFTEYLSLCTCINILSKMFTVMLLLLGTNKQISWKLTKTITYFKL